MSSQSKFSDLKLTENTTVAQVRRRRRVGNGELVLSTLDNQAALAFALSLGLVGIVTVVAFVLGISKDVAEHQAERRLRAR